MEKHFPYLFWAYNIIWILMVGYLLWLGARLRRVRRDLENLRSSMDAAARGRQGM